MTRRSGIILAVLLAGVLVLASIALAQEMAGKSEEKEDAQTPVMTHDRWRMGRGRGMMSPGQGRGLMMRRGRGMDPAAPMPPGRGRGRMMGRTDILLRLADKLELSEEQREEIKGIFSGHQKDAIKMKADLELAGVELRELMMQEEPDLDAIEDQIRNIANLGAQMKFSQIKALVDAKSVLTEEQQETLKKTLKDGASRMMGRRRGRSGMRGSQHRPGPGHTGRR
jgi:Spy/CpxP family protein refolding chaperone